MVKKQRLLVSVSGGRTSALMAFMLWTRYKDAYEFLFIFANTSREKEETLLFVHQLEQYFGFPIVWVEAVVHHGRRKSSTHKVVNYQTAARDGSVFEEVIKKYGIPNKKFKHCTRELKTNPIRSYAKSIGWGHHKKYTTVIGYRYDEKARVGNPETQKDKNQWYPLYDWQIKKPDVAVFWKRQIFDLQLPDYDGNCKLCYKKSKRKLLTQIKTKSVTEEDIAWVARMQTDYAQVKPKKMQHDKTPVRFFREGETIEDLLEEAKEDFKIAVDQSLKTDNADYDFDLDEQESCAESCEPFQ